ncbi:PLD nuclease N-terminal domain-containing protein [Parafrigoribacterium soli]|uniref:PLD nuclease N-terminal domain-containing protein n=1 Tax=Parafrigoribacterium soli TaxID=3144663 RepID=UPI0032EA9B98
MTNFDLSTLPPAVLIGLGVLLLAEVTLAVIALVSLVRRPVEQVALGNKWVWVAIIILLNVIGPILYFAIGRKAAAPVEGPAQSAASNPEGIADRLYGRRDDENHP